jgi:hypothetical protein
MKYRVFELTPDHHYHRNKGLSSWHIPVRKTVSSLGGRPWDSIYIENAASCFGFIHLFCSYCCCISIYYV